MLATLTSPKPSPRKPTHPHRHPTPHSPSRPALTPWLSPESCPARDCLSPSTWWPLCPAPSPCAPTPPCPSTGHAWRTGMWSCGSWTVQTALLHFLVQFVRSEVNQLHLYPPQIRPMPPRDTASWASHRSCPSWDPIRSCQNCSVWSPSELLWSPWWRSWKTGTCSATCGGADR